MLSGDYIKITYNEANRLYLLPMAIIHRFSCLWTKKSDLVDRPLHIRTTSLSSMYLMVEIRK